MKVYKLLIFSLSLLVLTSCSSSNKDETESKTQETTPNAVTANVDTISKASTTYFYEESSLKENSEELLDVLKSPSTFGAVSVATTNEDGSPNLATIVPSLVDEEKGYMIMAFGGDSSTKINITERKLAVLGIFKHTPDSENKQDRNQGARIVLEYVDNQENVIKELIEDSKIDEESASSAVVLKIVKVLPLG